VRLARGAGAGYRWGLSAWKELKVGCVFDIAQRRQFDPHTQEEVELGSAPPWSYPVSVDSLTLRRTFIENLTKFLQAAAE
jgi:hypothetical protein